MIADLFSESERESLLTLGEHEPAVAAASHGAVSKDAGGSRQRSASAYTGCLGTDFWFGRQMLVLLIIFALNLVLGVVQLTYSTQMHSVALLGSALQMLVDTGG